jgi:eukaryotic-like serine/threonine-protein kinase
MSKLIPARLVLAAVATGAALVVALAVALAGGPAGAASHPRQVQHAAASAFSDWPMFRANDDRTGYSAETAISTTTASSLTSTFTKTLGNKSYVSPAVATSTTLGEALLYADANNQFFAFPAAGGKAVWVYKYSGGTMEASPDVFDGVVYLGTTNGTLYALNSSTGALLCTYSAVGSILASPVVASDPDGSGPVVYFGTTPDKAGSGSEYAVYGPGNTHGNCTKDWDFKAFATAGGSWSSPAYATDAAGEPLLVFGSKDPDDSVYALDANTGALVWSYKTSNVLLDDVGAPPTISAPGNNGFADGVVYITGKDKVVYALDLTTGSLIWSYKLQAGSNASTGDLSGAALVGTAIYVGSDDGMYALNAVTGKLIWHVLPKSTFYDSPAITGPASGRVLIAADIQGHIYVLNLENGHTLWVDKPTTTGGYYASPAVSQGSFFIVGFDGILRKYTPTA